jgi:acyl dehydratase
MDTLRTWSVEARNLPEHAGNPIHTDAGARAAGFPSALVAGVTTYAYLTHPAVAAWGRDWLEHGGGEVRFRAPVLAGDRVECTPRLDGDQWHVDAICPAQERNPRATFALMRDSGPPPTPRSGDELPSRRIVLGERYGADYGSRAGDDLAIYQAAGIVHPAVWPALANHVYSTDLVDGPWIHTRSIIRHHAVGPAGAAIDVHATVVDRFDRHGERAVCDIVIEHRGTILATIEHEAIVRLPQR